jgi:hypothetical protein
MAEHKTKTWTQSEIAKDKHPYPGKVYDVEANDAPAKTNRLPRDLTDIPHVALQRIADIFAEGRPKYGKDNWCNGVKDDEYQLERANHALDHLLAYTEWRRGRGPKPAEDCLAKVAWFCVTQMWIEWKESEAGQ